MQALHTQSAQLSGARVQQRPARQQRAPSGMQTRALFGKKANTAVEEAAPAKPARGGLLGGRGSSKQAAAPAKQQTKGKVDKAAEYE